MLEIGLLILISFVLISFEATLIVLFIKHFQDINSLLAEIRVQCERLDRKIDELKNNIKIKENYQTTNQIQNNLTPNVKNLSSNVQKLSQNTLSPQNLQMQKPLAPQDIEEVRRKNKLIYKKQIKVEPEQSYVRHDINVDIEEDKDDQSDKENNQNNNNEKKHSNELHTTVNNNSTLNKTDEKKEKDKVKNEKKKTLKGFKVEFK